ncbi:MAG: hypothetical protein LRZ85_06450 [Alphaproteobacteria bacterium]|nr:hypothetical protein [Alphaproteobacteria bacterium]MCD8519963.1 hypothetical protein [Alphaproteobacteria bacterium]MCD8526397.1 hypothetical protein [Alphaproteobacteria bacterium]MCD8571541.1 hypothetical protein [Alphaproteobacteria bacterium]
MEEESLRAKAAAAARMAKTPPSLDSPHVRFSDLHFTLSDEEIREIEARKEAIRKRLEEPSL